jgi:hypothetical protein
MSEPEAGRAQAVVVLGPSAHDEIVAHTRSVLNHFGIPFAEVGWLDAPNFFASGGANGVGVLVFATGIAYTDEHIRLPEGVIVPAIRFITDPQPPPDQLLTATPLMASAGFGPPGAINAGLLAARILAISDAVLKELLGTRPYPIPPAS